MKNIRGYWGIVYIALWPLFAILYTFLPTEFRHSSLPIEADTLHAKLVLDRKVFEAVEEFPIGDFHSPVKGNWDLISKGSNEREVWYWYRFIEDVTIQETVERAKPNNIQIIRCSIPLQFEVARSKSHYTLDCSAAEIDDLTQNKTPSGDFPKMGTSLSQEKYQIAIGALHRIRLAMSGIDGGSAFERFGRMLYFSAVTQTTLGYGDILPVNRWSRWLVTIQSMLGVVIIGLFINHAFRGNSDQA